uniref:Dere\GG24735-PA n=1 Tax=Haemonchus contortus TaxID=6289 RepID=W6ND31_HAECO
MRRIGPLLLALLAITNAQKNFRTFMVPIGANRLTNLREIRRHESAETVTKRTQTYVESSREERIRREKEEEEELARVLDWEQKQIKELQERRERLKRERDEEIQRLLKKRAEEQAQLEAARAERRRVRALEERRKMLKEAKEERDRQEKLLVELERQKQTEIERLREQRSRQQRKEEEGRRKMEIEARRRVKEEEEIRRKREEEKRRRKEEEELRRKHQDEAGKETEEVEKEEEEEDFDERRLGEELERRIMQKEEEQRQNLVREKSRIEHQQHQQRMAEDERRHMREEVERFNMEKSKNERQSTRGQQRRRYIGMNQFEDKIEQKQEEEQSTTTSIKDENQMEETELSTLSVDDLSGRREELLNKFGEQARHRSSGEKRKQTDDKSEKVKIYSTNELRSSAPDSEDGPEEDKFSRPVDRTKNENQSLEKEHENGVNDENSNISENREKALVRKTIQRRLRGIKTFAEPKDVKSSVDDSANSDATYLGGWKESSENVFFSDVLAEMLLNFTLTKASEKNSYDIKIACHD